MLFCPLLVSTMRKRKRSGPLRTTPCVHWLFQTGSPRSEWLLQWYLVQWCDRVYFLLLSKTNALGQGRCRLPYGSKLAVRFLFQSFEFYHTTSLVGNVIPVVMSAISLSISHDINSYHVVSCRIEVIAWAMQWPFSFKYSFKFRSM